MSAPERLNWGIIGCSDIARSRGAAAIRENPRCRLLSVLSRDEGRARQFAAEHGVGRAYTELGAFLADPELHAVYVATELDRHCAETVAAAEAGRHVLCEKPMAMTAAECRRMIDACAHAGVGLQIAYYRRYYPKAQRMKERIDAGAIGRPVAARTALSGRLVPAPEDPKRWRVVRSQGGGGALMDVGSHYLDLMAWMLGPPRDVQAAADRLVQKYEVADTETCLVRFESGAHLTAHFNWNLPGTLHAFEIHGTDGALLASPFDQPDLVLKTPKGEERFHLPRAANTHAPLFDDFTERVLARQAPRFTGEDGAVATSVILAAYRSSETGRRVTVAPAV